MKISKVRFLVLSLLLTLSASGQQVILPDPHLTPGAWDRNATAEDVCTPGYARAPRPSAEESNRLKHEVFARYGIPWSEHKQRELDHLCPLELGGTSQLENLWPQPWPEATIKDRLEDYVHALVCSGQLSLHDAQMQIAADWRKMYERLIGTLPDHELRNRFNRPALRTAP